MPTLTLSEILKTASTILLDLGAVRWKLEELQRYVNASYRAIVNQRPDANAAPATVTLAAGTRQKLSDTGSINLPKAIRVLDVVRNMSSNSTKTAVKRMDRSVLDTQLPTWHNASPSINVYCWVFDYLTPKEFLVYPPATDTAQVEIIYSSVPDPHTWTEYDLKNGEGDTDLIKLDDTYFDAMLDYVLHLAYLKEGETVNEQRSAFHLNGFLQKLGVKTSTDLSVDKVNKGAQ
jgi:hypothetical protein